MRRHRNLIESYMLLGVVIWMLKVGAGLPVIASLNRILSSGDPVHHIIGSLSGTMGYVMSEVEDGKPFSQVVKSAKSLGYTEPGALRHYCFDGCEAWHGRAQGSF
ncbi:hypothetical protein CsSME_00023838 [Camellia sinensis var. sinensis]